MNKLLLVLPLAFIVFFVGWWFISPLLITETVDEVLPEVTKEETPSAEVDTSPEPLYLGVFQEADSFHKTSGTARVEERSGQRFLYLENFSATNGPDLFVYLATDTNASEFVNLGELKGNEGNQFYAIPEDVDLEEHSHALIWCKAFGVLFGSAKLE